MRIALLVPGWTWLVLLCTWSQTALAEVLVDLRHLEDSQFEQEFFRLERPTKLHIECEGAGEHNDPSLFAYGWLLQAGTRDVPWALQWENSDDAGRNRLFDDVIELAAGDYVASYGAFWTSGARVFKLFGREIVRIDGGKKHVSSKDMRRWKLVISTVDDADASHVEVLSDPPPLGDDRAFIRLAPMGDDEYKTQGFTLTQTTTFEVYCQGEFVPGTDGPADLGWIQDARTRKRLWAFSEHNSKHGGGSYKNRVAHQNLTLSAGDYIAGYATDGSHSASAWNAFPPYDPNGWGMILFASSARVARSIPPFVEDEKAQKTLVALTQQGDYVFARHGFELKTAADVRIYAMGEYDISNHQFVDQGWVEEFGSGKEIWKMQRHKSRPAGGASKNLVVEEVVAFQPGKYVVYYTSDDSHSFSRWNAPAPHDARFWGISLTAADSDFDMSNVEQFDAEDAGKGALVRITRVRSGEHMREILNLDKPTRLRIVALGEGDSEGMYDYAWIEDRKTGRWVWEMRFKETRHAGGDRKNRLFDRVIEFDRGEYEVHYTTDDSHAWGDWNRPHPHRPEDWGVTVSLAPE